jgi:hypothetical protein
MLTMYYHPEVMGSVNNLAIHYWDAVDDEWERVGGQWTELNNSVAVTVEQLGIYALADLAPYFTLDVQPESQSLTQGESAVYSVTLNAYQGFTESVSLSVSSLPGGASAIFGDTPLTPSASTPLTITTAASTLPGDYAVQVRATGGGISRTQSMILEVQPRPTFTLNVKPESQSLVQGESAVYTVMLDAYQGFAEPVDLSVVSGLPVGADATFGSNSLTPPASTPLIIATTISTPADDYTLWVQAMGGEVSHTQSVTLKVRPYIVYVYLPLILKH